MLAAARKSLILFTSRSKIPAVILMLCIAAVAFLEMLSIGLVIPLIQSSTIGPDQTGVSAQFTQALSWFGLGTEPFTISALFASVFVIKNLAILFFHMQSPGPLLSSPLRRARRYSTSIYAIRLNIMPTVIAPSCSAIL